MDPNTTNHPTSYELPEPVKAQEKGKSNKASIASEVPQKTESLNMELPGGSAMVSPSSAPASVAPSHAVSKQAVQNTSPPLLTNMPALADDVDLIEKEWVQKAKAIVAHTKTDPNLQNKELNKVKADYIKKRYNKELKLGEE